MKHENSNDEVGKYVNIISSRFKKDRFSKIIFIGTVISIIVEYIINLGYNFRLGYTEVLVLPNDANIFTRIIQVVILMILVYCILLFAYKRVYTFKMLSKKILLYCMYLFLFVSCTYLLILILNYITDIIFEVIPITIVELYIAMATSNCIVYFLFGIVVNKLNKNNCSLEFVGYYFYMVILIFDFFIIFFNSLTEAIEFFTFIGYIMVTFILIIPGFLLSIKEDNKKLKPKRNNQYLTKIMNVIQGVSSSLKLGVSYLVFSVGLLILCLFIAGFTYADTANNHHILLRDNIEYLYVESVDGSKIILQLSVKKNNENNITNDNDIKTYILKKGSEYTPYSHKDGDIIEVIYSKIDIK